MKETQPTVSKSFRLPPEMYQEIVKIVRENDDYKDFSDFVKRSLEAYVKTAKKKERVVKLATDEVRRESGGEDSASRIAQ